MSQIHITPEGHKISSLDLELMRAEILIHTTERVENETLFKIFDLFMYAKESSK